MEKLPDAILLVFLVATAVVATIGDASLVCARIIVRCLRKYFYCQFRPTAKLIYYIYVQDVAIYDLIQYLPVFPHAQQLFSGKLFQSPERHSFPYISPPDSQYLDA